MKLNDYLNDIVAFLKKYLVTAHADGYTLGLSGGIDSALVLGLLLKAVDKNKIHVVIMPIESQKEDADFAIELCDKWKVKYEVIDLTNSYHALAKNIQKNVKLNNLSLSNIKVRLRMVTLYAVAQSTNSLVVGTDNFDERYVGYFTKYGDGAADILPIARLTKSEVYKASEMLGVTKNILLRKPSAGLFAGQTDEADLGVTYKVLDNFLLGKKVSTKDKNRIEHLHKISEHKRRSIPTPPMFKR